MEYLLNLCLDLSLCICKYSKTWNASGSKPFWGGMLNLSYICFLFWFLLSWKVHTADLSVQAGSSRCPGMSRTTTSGDIQKEEPQGQGFSRCRALGPGYLSSLTITCHIPALRSTLQSDKVPPFPSHSLHSCDGCDCMMDKQGCE